MIRSTGANFGLAVLALGLGMGASPAAAGTTGTRGSTTTFEATAYAIEGKTSVGSKAEEGIVAADPAVLPLGSRIRIHEAGRYSGDYVVKDTGRTIHGREVDIYVGSAREAKRFGRRKVRVEVLERGTGPAQAKSEPIPAASMAPALR